MFYLSFTHPPNFFGIGVVEETVPEVCKLPQTKFHWLPLLWWWYLIHKTQTIFMVVTHEKWDFDYYLALTFQNKTASVPVIDPSPSGTDDHEGQNVDEQEGWEHKTVLWLRWRNNCSHLLWMSWTELSSQSGGVKRHAGCCVASVASDTNLCAAVWAQSLLPDLRIADGTQCMLIICGKHGEAVEAKQWDVSVLLCWASVFIYGAVVTTKCVVHAALQSQKAATVL